MATRTKTAITPVLLTLDSSCWIEYLRDTPRAELFAIAAENPEQLIVPVVTIYEVTKKLRREISAKVAAYAEALMCRGRVIDFDLPLSRAAITNTLPLADSLIYATAQAHDAILWTQDQHFEGLPGVKYFPKD
ncbi:MAG: type II toxin-antitoxin system VapC family toxin [Polaromonas sp.]|nr:type II toxin-antitoxin system VapC family toxin [Polaromonas sp.]